MKEYREESDEGVNVQPLKGHKPHMSLASTEEADDRVRATVVLREPSFADDGAEAGTKTGGEASEPKAIDRNCRTSGSLTDGRVRYVGQVRVTAVQQLVKE